MMTKRISAIAAMAAFLAAIPAFGVTVYGPGDAFTNPGATRQQRAIAGGPASAAGLNSSPDAWYYNNVGGSGLVGITSTYARSGNGSVEFGGASGSSKADIQINFGSFIRLGDVVSGGYDWYRAGTSTNPTAQVAAYKLLWANFDSSNQVTALGSLIFEPAYNGQPTPATNSWQTSSYTQSSGNFWLQQSGVGLDDSNANSFTRTLADYIGGSANAGFATLSGNTVIYGIQVGIGSGWNGTFSGAADNIALNSQSFNFEVIPTPMASLGGALLLGLVGGRRRR
jgi:hypothetical protein